MGPARSASCGKIRYTSREAAEAAATLKAETDSYPEDLRTYYHRACRGFHITSQSKRSS